MEYRCPKCSNLEFDQDKISVTGSGLSKMLDVQNRKYHVVSCRNCGYTEFYKGKTSVAGNVLDFLFGG